jgi:uncharacterized protein YhbP (UPF0306 family)
MSESNYTQALNYLNNHHVLTLATNGPQGLWAAALFYANDEFELIFLSAAHTRHAQNISALPKAAATIQENYANWQEIKGIQLEGMIKLLEGSERDKAIARYKAKFTFLEQESALRKAFEKVSWYKLLPHNLYFIDNSKGLGNRVEIQLPRIDY